MIAWTAMLSTMNVELDDRAQARGGRAMIDGSIYYEVIPEHYIGYSDPPFVITISAKASYLATRRSVIDSILAEAIRKINEAKE